MKHILSVLAMLTLAAAVTGCNANTPKPATTPPPTSNQVVRLEQQEDAIAYEAELPSAQQEEPLLALPPQITPTPAVEETPEAPEKELPQTDLNADTNLMDNLLETAVEVPDEVLNATKEKPTENTTPVLVSGKPKPKGETRAVWISYLDFNSLLLNKTESQFTANISDAFGKVKDAGLNTVIVQVRPFGDALYPSKYFPWSHNITGTEGKNPGFDPLKIMVREAHNRGLAIEAWVNPYRVRNTIISAPLSSSNPAQKWMDANSSAVISYGGNISYNPASKEAQKLIINGVTELVENYDIDGIHFDDYFYPSADAAFDQASYNSYVKNGGKKALADWRRSNVDTLVKDVYSAIKAIDPSVVFGISPQGNFHNNYNVQYCDVDLWLTTPGYVDYICPQLYWGFNHKSAPFKDMVKQWNSKVKLDSVDLYIGLAPYRFGTTDGGAGEGKNEWFNTTDILARMVDTARGSDSYSGFALFRYDFVFNPSAAIKAQVAKEMKNLKNIL